MTIISNTDEGASGWAMQLLDRIEREEVRLLSWGLVEGFFSKAELESLIDGWRVAARAPEQLSADDLLGELERRRLVIRLEYPGGLAYRSRMAETTRLLARLRQLFPRHLTGRGWESAPKLVSDFRIAL